MEIGDFIIGITPDYEEISGEIIEINEPVISDIKSAWILLDDGFKVFCFFEDMTMDVRRMRELKFKNIIDDI